MAKYKNKNQSDFYQPNSPISGYYDEYAYRFLTLNDIINNFIMNNLSDMDTSNLFADPENKYEDSYEQLENFRKK